MPMIAETVPVAIQDFPDGAQRFNWCTCQKSAGALSGVGDLLASNPAPRPLVDFDWWSQQLNGGGGATLTPAASAGASRAPAMVDDWPVMRGWFPWVLGGVAVVAAVKMAGKR